MRCRETQRLIWIQAIWHSDNIFTNFGWYWSTLKIEADEKFCRRQFIRANYNSSWSMTFALACSHHNSCNISQTAADKFVHQTWFIMKPSYFVRASSWIWTDWNCHFYYISGKINCRLLHLSSASIFKVLQCHWKWVKMLPRCQTACIWMRRQITWRLIRI